MITKKQYSTEEDRSKLISENSTLILIEEQNYIDGSNFLIFSDSPMQPEIIYTNLPKTEIDDLKQSIAELSMLITPQ